MPVLGTTAQAAISDRPAACAHSHAMPWFITAHGMSICACTVHMPAATSKRNTVSDTPPVITLAAEDVQGAAMRDGTAPALGYGIGASPLHVPLVSS